MLSGCRVLDNLQLPTLSVHEEGRCVRIRFKRANKANALDRQHLRALRTILTNIQTQDRHDVVVFDAEGRSFCAGLDLAWLGRCYREDMEQLTATNQLVGEVLACLWTLPMVTVMIVEGHVLGGGCGLLACADRVWAHPSTRIACPELSVGLVPGQIYPYLQARVGVVASQRLCNNLAQYSAQDWAEWGLIDTVSDHPQSDFSGWVGSQTPALLCAQKGLKSMVRQPLVDSAWQRATAQAFSASFARAAAAGLLNRFVT